MTEEERLLKNKQISISKQETLKKRQNQVCKTFTVKVSKNHLSKLQKEQLKMIFVEAKWIYNDMINWSSKEDNKIWNYNTKIKEISHKDKDGNCVVSELKYIGSSMKQRIVQNAVSNIKTLSTLKRKGKKIGRLKFKKEIRCIGLKQNNITHKIISKNRMKIQGISGSLFVNGLKQIKDDWEISSAKLEKILRENKQNDCSKMIITFGEVAISSVSYSEPNSVGSQIQHPTGDNINLHQNNDKVNAKIQKYAESIDNSQTENSEESTQETKVKNEENQIQDEQLKNWHKNGHGKAVQHSVLGRVKSKLTNSNNVCIISKWKPTTKLCMNCGEIHDEMKLSDRIFKCSCGIEMDRDVHAAQNILKFGLEKIGTDGIEFTPVDIKALLEELFNSENNLGG
jgi:hypothetical protein